MNQEVFKKINSADYLKDLQQTVEACIYCSDPIQRDRLEEKVLKLMEPRITSLASQNLIYKDDLAQELRLCVIETLRRNLKGGLRYDPSKGKSYLHYINASLRLTMISFLEKNSVIPGNIERSLFREDCPYDDYTREVLKSLTRPLSLPDNYDTSIFSPSVTSELLDKDEQEKRTSKNDRISEELYKHVKDPKVAAVILTKLRGYSKRDLRKHMHCQWSTLDNLLMEANILIERWRQNPPEWLVEFLGEVCEQDADICGDEIH